MPCPWHFKLTDPYFPSVRVSEVLSASVFITIPDIRDSSAVEHQLFVQVLAIHDTLGDDS